MIQGFRRFQKAMTVMICIVLVLTITPLIISSIALSHSSEFNVDTTINFPVENFEVSIYILAIFLSQRYTGLCIY